MRARLVRPEFWSDDVMGELTVSARLTYIGLWCVADDAGYLEWRPRQIGAAIYPFMAAGRRDKMLAADMEALREMGRLVVLDCGNHAVIPTLARHRITGGKLNERIKRAHDEQDRMGYPRRQDLVPAEPRGKNVPASVKAEVTERDGGRCRFCGEASRSLIFEHVDNFGKGTVDNIVLACRSCNVKKGHRTLTEAGMTLLSVPEVLGTDLSVVGTERSRSSSLSQSVSLSPSPSSSPPALPREPAGPFSSKTTNEGVPVRSLRMAKIELKLADPGLVPEYRQELEAELAVLRSAA